MSNGHLINSKLTTVGYNLWDADTDTGTDTGTGTGTPTGTVTGMGTGTGSPNSGKSASLCQF